MKIRPWAWKVALALVLLGAVGRTYLNSLQRFASHPVSRTRSGAIDGYDPVAYFREGRPLRGDPRYRHEWNGAVWLFASEANRAAFAAEPARYAPQFGGYCAWAVAHGYTAVADPEAWHIADGRLYLNFDLEVREQWLDDRDALIAAGERNWPRVIED